MLGNISYKPLSPNDYMVINVFFCVERDRFQTLSYVSTTTTKKNNIDSNEALLSYTTVIVITTWIGNK